MRSIFGRLLRSIPKDLQAADMSTFADLFCGIGGFHYAAEALGMRCVFASDIDEDCQRQYEHNFARRPKGDIKGVRESAVPDHDILFSGFPCQPFSIIGSRQGMSDERGSLIFDIVRVLRAKQPRAFMLENVAQLTTIQDGKVMANIREMLEGVGYECAYRVLNALDFGLPQKRERVIIVGFRDDSMKGFQWPSKKNAHTPLSEILETDPDKRFYVSKRIRNKRRAKHTAMIKPAIWHEKKGGAVNSHPFSCALRAGASHNYLLVDGERRLTPREQLRLQGFPERFEVIGNDSQIRKQTGNAVPVPLVRSVLKQILHAASQNLKQVREARTLSA